MSKAIWPGLDIKPAADGEMTREIYLEAVKPLILPKGVGPAIGTRVQGIGGPGKTNVAGFYPGFEEWSEIDILPPAPEKIQAVVAAGKVSLSQAASGAVAIRFPDHEKVNPWTKSSPASFKTSWPARPGPCGSG